jgi:hypothetical protein
MNLKYILCQIDANRRKLHFGRLSWLVGISIRHTLALLMPFQVGATIPLAEVIVAASLERRADCDGGCYGNFKNEHDWTYLQITLPACGDRQVRQSDFAQSLVLRHLFVESCYPSQNPYLTLPGQSHESYIRPSSSAR